eukprot:gene4466-5477_t
MDQLGNLFHDLSFAIVRHGLIEGEFEEATTLVLRHGGKVAYTFDGPKYTYAANRPNQQVVNHMWLEDSLMNWAKQDENNYKRSGQEVDAIANAEVKPVSVPPKVSPFEAAGAGEEAPSNGPPTVWHAAPTSEQLARPRVSTVASPDWSQLKRDGAAVVWSARSNLDPTLQVRTGAVEERADFVGLCPNSPSDLEREVFGRASEIPAPWPVFQGDVQRASSAIPVCPKEFAKRPRCDAGRLKSVLGGHRQFELLEGPPHKSEGSRIRVLSLRKRGYLAALRDASEDSLASWKEAAASAASALSHRNVQRAVQCQFDLEIAKQAPLADAVLETFCTAYLPCAVAITDPFKSILKDVKLKPVKYTLLQLVENFHEFLGGRFPPLCSQEERARSSEQGAAHASPRAPLVAEMGSGAPPGLKEGCEDETAMPTLPEIDDDETQVEEEWRSAPSSPQRPAVGNSPSNAVHVATHTAALERSPDTGITGAGVRSSGQPRQRTASLSPRRLMCDTDLHHELGAGLPHGQPGEAAPMAETEARGEALLEEIVSPKLPRCSGEAVLSSGEAVASPGVYDCETQRETETVPCSLQERYDSGALPGAALEGEQGPGIVTCEDPGGNEVGPRDNDGGAEETEVEGYDTHMTGSGSTPAKPVEVAADDVRTPWAFGAAPAVETPAVETQEMAAETPSAAWSNMPLRVLNDELVKTVVRGAKASECPRGNAAFNDDDDAMQAMVDCAAPRRHKSPVPRKVTAQAAELPVPDADKENSEADVATYQHAGSTAQAGMAVAMSEATSPEWMVSSTAQKKGVPVEEAEPAAQEAAAAGAEVASPVQRASGRVTRMGTVRAGGREAEEGSPQAEPAAQEAAAAGAEVANPVQMASGRVTRMGNARARGREAEEGSPQAEPAAQEAAAAGAEVASPVQMASGRVTRMGTVRAGGREAEEGSPQAEPAAQEAAAAGAEVASPAEPAAQEAAAAGAEVASPAQAHIPEAGSDAVPEGGAQSVRTARTSALPPERGSPAPVRKRVRAALDDDDAPEEVAAGPADALGEQDKQQAELEARVRKKGRGSRRVDALDQPTGRPGCETEHHMNSVRAVQHNEEEEADVALEESCEYAAGDEQDRLHGGHDGVEAHCMDAQDGGGELPAGPAGELESTRNASRTRRVPLAGAMEEPRAGSLSRGGLAVVVALSGMHREEQRARGAAVRKLGWELCTGHEWDPRTTHVVFGGSGSRGEKFLAGAAAGALLVNEAYLEESARSHVAVVPRPELLWDGGRGRECGLIEEGVAHHWQAWREVMGSGPFHGMKIVLFGAFPTRAALMRTITAGGGTPITASPTTSASSQTALGRMVAANELAFAIEDPARPLSSTWVKRLLAAKVSCLSPDFIIDWIARPHMDLQ